jgi:hypothetical protein
LRVPAFSPTYRMNSTAHCQMLSVCTEHLLGRSPIDLPQYLILFPRIMVVVLVVVVKSLLLLQVSTWLHPAMETPMILVLVFASPRVRERPSYTQGGDATEPCVGWWHPGCPSSRRHQQRPLLPCCRPPSGWGSTGSALVVPHGLTRCLQNAAEWHGWRDCKYEQGGNCVPLGPARLRRGLSLRASSTHTTHKYTENAKFGM